MLSTVQKVRIAQIASFLVRAARAAFGLRAQATVTRGSARWELDLREGIDLSIYLLGGFEPATLRRYPKFVEPGDIVLDIGANIGAHTLPLAQRVGPAGRVIAFEPTAFAFAKLRRNLALNPDLAIRVDARQTMLASEASSRLPESIYSSWPLDGGDDLHQQHRGRLKSTHGADQRVLDDLLDELGLAHIDLIKLDVDGNELEVLRGARTCLQRYGPVLMLELAPYVSAANPGEFDGLLELLWGAGYSIFEAANGRALPDTIAGVRARIAPGAGLNAFARRIRTAAAGTSGASATP